MRARSSTPIYPVATALPRREALHRWYEVLPIAASGVTFVITSREYPLAQLGPLTRAAAEAAPAPQERAARPDLREAARTTGRA